MVAWMTGMLGGASMAYFTWRGFFVTGIHGKVALVILPLILFGLFSGLYMNRKKQKRKFLPIAHGLINLTVLLLALYQMSTGWWVYNVYVLGH
jgi:uncharacterized membrane protein